MQRCPCPGSQGLWKLVALVTQELQENLDWDSNPQDKGPPLGPMLWALPSEDFPPPSWEATPFQAQSASRNVLVSQPCKKTKHRLFANNFYFYSLDKLPKGTRVRLQVWIWEKVTEKRKQNKQTKNYLNKLSCLQIICKGKKNSNFPPSSLSFPISVTLLHMPLFCWHFPFLSCFHLSSLFPGPTFLPGNSSAQSASMLNAALAHAKLAGESLEVFANN